jgi:hypothetical protein
MHVGRDPYPGIFWQLLGYGLWEIFGQPTEDAMSGWCIISLAEE